MTIKSVDAAEIVNDVVPVRHNAQFDTLTIPVPDGYADIKRVCKVVLKYNGAHYTFTGWNSDRNEAYYKRSAVATIVRRK